MMLIKLYGTRGSIPVSSRSIRKYGGNTTCLYVESENGDSIIVDAGSGIRDLGLYLTKNNKSKLNLLFTHYHWDHMQGMPFFIPIFLKNSTINIYGPNKEVSSQKALSHQMHRPYFPTVAWSGLPARIQYNNLKKHFRIGRIKVSMIANNHPNYTVGFRFTERGRSFAFLTDNELFAQRGKTTYKQFVTFVRGVDLLIHDAQYTDDIYKMRLGWGHSTYNQVMNLARDARVKRVLFTHHDPASTDGYIDRIVKTVKRQFPGLRVEAAAEGRTIILK